MEGTVTVSDRAVMQLAAHIAERQAGVKRLADKNNSDFIARILKGENDTKGVYIKKTKQGISLEIRVVCAYGTNTVRLCGEITKSIKDELTETGFRIKTVYVCIAGVE